jgi:hypothetical protein
MERKEEMEVKEVEGVKERAYSVAVNWYDQEGCPLFLRRRRTERT